MKLSIVIVNYQGVKHTLSCVASIRAFPPSCAYEIIVVDNGSSVAEGEELKQHLPDCTIVFSGMNLGFGGANNLGAGQAKGEILFFLNNDTVLTSDIFAPLVDSLDRDATRGLVGPSLRNADGTFQVSFGLFPTVIGEWETRRLGRRFNARSVEANKIVERWMCQWISGAAMMVRKECFDRLGGFDPSYFMYFEDVDLCYRAKQGGWEVWYESDCSLIHLGGMSYSSGDALIRKEYRRSQLRYYDKFCSRPQRVLLRLYLLLKTFIWLFGPERQAAAAVMRMVFQSHGK